MLCARSFAGAHRPFAFALPLLADAATAHSFNSPSRRHGLRKHNHDCYHVNCKRAKAGPGRTSVGLCHSGHVRHPNKLSTDYRSRTSPSLYGNLLSILWRYLTKGRAEDPRWYSMAVRTTLFILAHMLIPYSLDCIWEVGSLFPTQLLNDHLQSGSLLCTFSVLITTDALWYFVFGNLFQQGSRNPPW